MTGLERAGPRVKICGLATVEAVSAAVDAGAAYLGFVFFPKSPRAVTPPAAAELAAQAPPGVCKVGLVVDPDDADLDALIAQVPLDMLQLHGRETPARVADIRRRVGLPIMKAAPIGTAEDVAALSAYEAVSDQILCDAKPKPGEELPGGNGVAFDWSLLEGRRWRRPWMLAGGLTAETLAAAIARTGASQVDVSSGVESAPGRKDPARIRAFMSAARRVTLGGDGG